MREGNLLEAFYAPQGMEYIMLGKKTVFYWFSLWE